MYPHEAKMVEGQSYVRAQLEVEWSKKIKKIRAKNIITTTSSKWSRGTQNIENAASQYGIDQNLVTKIK